MPPGPLLGSPADLVPHAGGEGPTDRKAVATGAAMGESSPSTFMIGALAGPLFVGKALDVSGEYTLGWLVSGLVVSLSAIAMWAARADTRLITEHRALALAPNDPIE